jgi:hypothetical protein
MVGDMRILLFVLLVDGVFGLLASGAAPSVFRDVKQGCIAVVPNWIPKSLVAALCEDAASLYGQQMFSADGLAAYTTERRFDASRDRMTFRGDAWGDASLGSIAVRRELGARIASLRMDCVSGLGRTSLAEDTPRTHEITYSRFGPGASLGRHLDEHHEETKGLRGWTRPTRRSVSWLVYLQPDDWDAKLDGGSLCSFERTAKIPPDGGEVGAHEGDLQVGWRQEPDGADSERPVFMDANCGGLLGGSALYYLCGAQRSYLTRPFQVPAEPIPFVSFMTDPREAALFRRVAEPRSTQQDMRSGKQRRRQRQALAFDRMRERPKLVPVEGGTLVLFDSVSLPHEVLVTLRRERFAATGWFHEAQQELA